MRKLAAFVLALVALIALAIWLSFPTASYRYRLTIAVEVDGQVHSGSSVIEVWYRFNPQWLWPLFGMYNMKLWGQAVLVDLGSRGTLLASLGKYTDPNTVSADFLAGRAFQPSARQGGGWYAATLDRVRDLSHMQGHVDLTPDNLPLFLWFTDLNNADTARVAKPADFSSVIGDAARLALSQVEITHDAIVIDLDKRLPWYNNLKARNGVLTVNGLLFGYGSFIGNGYEQ